MKKIPGPTRGFALVIVVALLALLMVALVSLATLTRIEAGVGENSIKLAQARQNARFALEQALGELQRHAGPDTRITATAEISGVNNANKHWTGIWPSAGGTAQTWLVSGNENGAVDHDPTTASIENLSTSSHALSGDIEVDDLPARVLVGPNTADDVDAANFVIAPLVDLEGPVAGESGNKTVGRYAWWVGDEGVKASMALRDRTDEVDYGPYASDELRARLRQQVAMGHQQFSAVSGGDGFDPALPANSTALRNVIERNQLPFLTKAAVASLLTTSRERFHDWTTISSGVLASTNSTYPGLRRDLSRAPGLLGESFERWADFANATNMQPVGGASTAVPAIVDAADARRVYAVQHRLIEAPADDSLVRQVAPVLVSFLIHFTVARETPDPIDGRSRIRITARAQTSSWNPYASAITPPQMEVSLVGLPEITLRVENVVSGSPEEVNVDLAELFAQGPAFGEPFTVRFGFQNSRTNASDAATWFPGRIHNWRTPGSDSMAGLPPNGLLFYGLRLKDSSGLNSTVWSRLWTDPSGVGDSRLPGAGTLSVLGPPTQLSYRFSANGSLVSETVGPTMSSVFDTGGAGGARSFAFGFRLRQPPAFLNWLDGLDPRSADLPAIATMAFDPSAGGGLNPSDYGSGWPGYNDGVLGLLLTRDTNQNSATMSFNNDTPVFELSRQPALSLASLQHLQVAGARPFAIGNSWGAGVVPPLGVGGYSGGTVGSWFDRFYFSGLTEANPAGVAGVLPVFHLRGASSTGAPVTWDELHDPGAQGAYTSRFLLVDGAFNVNSTNPDAWAAVLRSVRPFASGAVTKAELADGDPYDVTGTVGASGDVSMPEISDETQGIEGTLPGSPSGFFRFSQSMQETFMTTGPAGGIDRTRYRVGFRGGTTGPDTTDLSSAQIDTLANRIVARVREVGPIRTLEKFVSPSLPVGAPTRSILEAAIADAKLNDAVPELCSQHLTQADILTAIGPFLQCRSDTFLIRAYGETLNPVTQAVEARAWCEAVVQRIPTPVADGDPVVQPTGPFGRRFVITSFRWLSPDDV